MPSTMVREIVRPSATALSEMSGFTRAPSCVCVSEARTGYERVSP